MNTESMELYEQLTSGQTDGIEPKSEAEALLLNMTRNGVGQGTGSSGGTEPRSRIEAYLKAMIENGLPGGGSGSGSGGSASIDVTAEVGQTIIVKEVDENGKPTKWESADYQPRTHWSEETVVLPEITADVDFDLGGIILNTIDFVSGAEYAVTHNGVKYTCKGVNLIHPEYGIPMSAIGYTDIFFGGDFPDADVPFVIATADFMGEGTSMTMLMPMGEDTTITVSVAKIGYTQIPDGYISKCLPFRFNCTTDGVTYTFTAKPAEVMAAVDAGRQVIMTYKYGNLMQLYLPLMSITGEEHTFAAGDKSFDLVVQADGTYAMKNQS